MQGRTFLIGLLVFILAVSCQAQIRSIDIETLTWQEAEKAFQNYDVVLISLGARTKEHGPHLPLNNDYVMAEYLKKRVMDEVPVMVFPTLQYGFYPAFLEYPGSVSLQSQTFKNIIIDICKSIHGYGIHKFYILNTGISTLRPLNEAKKELAQEGITLEFLDLRAVKGRLPDNLLQQKGGSHADEGETSEMLYIAPQIVDMSKAVDDYDARPDRRGLTRDPEGTGSYSPTGIWGNPTLATEEKGKVLVEATVDLIVEQIEGLLK